MQSYFFNYKAWQNTKNISMLKMTKLGFSTDLERGVEQEFVERQAGDFVVLYPLVSVLVDA